MKALLVSLVTLATLMTSCNAYCHVLSLEEFFGNSTLKCEDLFEAKNQMNMTWETTNCEECSCKEHKVYCCSKVAVPVNFDRSKCQEIFHKENCSYTVVERDNPEKTCVVSAWIL